MKFRRFDVGLFLFLIILFIRLPFFFRDYIDHDESTFILMGASVAEGHLPYAHIWDLKSPFLFYVFGLIEIIFPDSFVAIRLFGVLVIFLSTILLLRIAERAGYRNGLLMAVGYALLSSLFGSLQGVMSEHIAVLFILLLLYTLTFEITSKKLFLAGLLAGLTLLCKLNYAYAIVFLFIYLISEAWRRENMGRAFTAAVLLGVGTLFPFVIVALPFIAEGELKLYIDSTFLAPFAYGHAGTLNIFQKIGKTWWIVVFSLLIGFFSYRKTDYTQRRLTIMLILLLTGTVFSFVTSGKVNGHYLIEIYPFLLLLGGRVIITRQFRPSLWLVSLFVLAISFESWKEYVAVGRNWANNGTPFNGKSYLVIDKLKSEGIAHDKIFFADYHIAYWLLDAYPLTKSTTHPSNLARPYLFKYFGNNRKTSIEELKYILEVIKPNVIVSRKPFISFLSPDGEENHYFSEYANANFNLIMENEQDRIYIWRRNMTTLSQLRPFLRD